MSAVNHSVPLLRLFGRDERANVAMLFGLSMIPIVGLVGAGIDYSMSSALRTRLQVATDTTALALAQQTNKMTDAQLRDFAEKTIKAEMGDQPVHVDSLNISNGRTEVVMNTSSHYLTNFMGLVGVSDVPLGASTKTVITNNTYEIAMVIDNSGSMASSAGGKSKMDAAKEAAKKLVTTMFTSETSASRTKISLVPFTLSVKVGANYAGSSWLDTQGQSSIHWQNIDQPKPGDPFQPKSRFDLFAALGNTPWGGCVESRPGVYGVTDDPPTSGVGDSLFVPQFAPDEPGPASSSSNSWSVKIGSKTTSYTYLNSYLADKQAVCTALETTNTNTSPTAYADAEQKRLCKYRSNPPKNISNNRGPNYNCDAKPLSRMTDQATELNSSIDSMAAAGNTDLLEGLMWGWRTITPNGPFADGRSYSTTNNNKVIVLLTDGMNAWNAASNHNYGIYSPFGFYTNDRLGTGATSAAQARSQLDAKTLVACTNAKARGITIYTIGFSVAGDPIDSAGLSLLKKCATSESMAYVANNSSDIVTVFEEIAHNIGGLRITM